MALFRRLYKNLCTMPLCFGELIINRHARFREIPLRCWREREREDPDQDPALTARHGTDTSIVPWWWLFIRQKDKQLALVMFSIVAVDLIRTDLKHWCTDCKWCCLKRLLSAKSRNVAYIMLFESSVV